MSIPDGPIDTEPYDAIPMPLSEPPEVWRQDAKAALLAALDGIELGAYDRRIVESLPDGEISTVAVICSWLHRARAAGEQARS